MSHFPSCVCISNLINSEEDKQVPVINWAFKNLFSSFYMEQQERDMFVLFYFKMNLCDDTSTL